MAGISAIANLAAPLERLFKELRAYQVSNSELLVDLITAGTALIATALQNKAGLHRNLTEEEQGYLHRIEDVEKSLLAALLLDDGAIIKTPNPQAISQFLANGMDSLLEADLLLRKWQQTGDFGVLYALCNDLVEVADGADQAEQPRIHELATGLHGFYQQASKAGAETQAAEQNNWAELAMEGQEQLLNMMDCLAAGQVLERPIILDRILGVTHLLEAWLTDAAGAEGDGDNAPFGEAPVLSEGDIPSADAIPVLSVTAAFEADTDTVENEAVDAVPPAPFEWDVVETEIDFQAEEEKSDAVEDSRIIADVSDEIEIQLPESDVSNVADLEIEFVLDEPDVAEDITAVVNADDTKEAGFEVEWVSTDAASREEPADEELPLLSAEPFVPQRLDVDGPEVDFSDLGSAFELDDPVREEHREAFDNPETTDTKDLVETPEAEDSLSLPDVSDSAAEWQLPPENLAVEHELQKSIESLGESYPEQDLETLLSSVPVVDDTFAELLSNNDIVDDEQFELEAPIDLPEVEEPATDHDHGLLQESADGNDGNNDGHIVAEHDLRQLDDSITIPESESTVTSPLTAAAPEWIVEDVPPAMLVDDGSEEILEIFLEEAEEIIESVDRVLGDWRTAPDNLVNVAHLQRDLHTLKGGARMAEQAEVAELCHDLETLYERINNGRLGVEPGLFTLLQAAHDDLGGQLDSIRHAQVPRSADSILLSLKAYMQGEVVHDPNASDVTEAEALEDLDDSAVAVDLVKSESLDESDREILEIFLDEAAELYEALDQAVQEWEKTPTNMEPANEAQRVLHTFKGGARLAGLVAIGDQAHEFESRILRVQQGYLNADPEFFKSAYQEQDALARQIERIGTMLQSGEMVLLGDTSVESAPLDQWSDNPSVEKWFANPELDDAEADEADQKSVSAAVKAEDDDPGIEELPAPESAPVPVASASAEPTASNVVPLRTTMAPVTAAAVPASVAEAAQQVAARRAPQELVKVSADLLDDLVNLAGETSIGRGRLEQQVTDFSHTLEEMEGTLDRLRDQLRRLDIETEAQVLFRQERHGPEYEDFDPLEMDRYSTIQQLSRALIESASDLLDIKDTLSNKTRDAETLLLQQSRVNTELQEGLMKTRMVPFQRLVPRLRRIVRQVSLELDKQVEFRVLNAEGELDRTILERMISPLEHMVRNAVDHGIESLEDRRVAGKPDIGTIDLAVSREGSDVVLTLRDDGKGINREAVRAKAIERGLLAQDARVSDHDLLQFILQAGFSTAKNVTQISGRGVGLDVVSTEIKQMGGTVEILSEEGAGTRFVVRLPFTVSVNRALMVRIGDDLYAIPLNNIQGIVRASGNELQGYYQLPSQDRQYQYSGQDYRLEYLGVMLENESQPKVVNQNLPLPILLINGVVPYALQVDSLLGSREIVVKALGPQFASVMGVSGGTILGDGSVVIILDLPAMIRSQASLEYQQAKLLDARMAEQRHEQAARAPRVLVVDDSVTVRKVTTRLLERHGLEVFTASDGVDAMATLQDHHPDLMLLDIEMPRMDGFEVASLVRHDERLKSIPIIMITSRTGDKHRDRAMAIGVNEYLGKPFQEELLLATMNRLLGREGN